MDVIDLASRLAGAVVATDGSIVLAEYGSKHVGIAVDEVRDVQILPMDRFERATGDVARGGIVSGLGHLDDGVVIVLDVPKRKARKATKGKRAKPGGRKPAAKKAGGRKTR